jgi:putative endopeptidase
MQLRFTLFAMGSLLLLGACSQKPTDSAQTTAYVNRANMDTTVAPGDDFFTYAHGTWIKNSVIPGTEASIGSFTDVYNTTKANIRILLDEAAKTDAARGTIEQQVGSMYASAMDSITIDKLGKAPIQPYLDKIAALKTPTEAILLNAAWSKEGMSTLLNADVTVDEKRSSQYILSTYQTGLGLPDRDYYFKTDLATQQVVASYKKYVKTLFMLLGDDSTTAAKNTTLVYDLEKSIAESHRTNVALRDPQLNYNKWALTDLEKKWPNLGFRAMVSAAGATPDSLDICQPDYYTKLNTLVKTVPLSTWQAYFRKGLADNSARYLSNDFVKARFEHGKILSGQTVMKPRWERMYRVVDASLGDPLSQLYVKKHFTTESKKRMDELVANLTTAFEKRIEKLDWMTDTTKREAKAKLATIIKKIGYPDTWRDFSKVDISKDNFFANVIACKKANNAFELSKLGKPIDKTEWGMTAPTINAYYNPTINEIVFPAGILQFPFFDLGADDAVNYGAIGLVIGHEITHGFDDQGSQYDKEGNLKNWWRKSDNEKFKTKGQLVVKQYNAFTILDTVHVSGALTLGENMADIGGLAIAYDAFKMTKQGQSAEKIDGFTPDQRFFLGFAGAWKNKETPESERQQVLTDPHSPAQFRVNGPLCNFTPFYEAFGVKPGQKMFKPEAERIKIW